MPTCVTKRNLVSPARISVVSPAELLFDRVHDVMRMKDHRPYFRMCSVRRKSSLGAQITAQTARSDCFLLTINSLVLDKMRGHFLVWKADPLNRKLISTTLPRQPLFHGFTDHAFA